MTQAHTIAAILTATIFLTGCTSVTRWSDQPTLQVPSTYHAEMPEGPKIKDSLLELFANEELRNIVNQALVENFDLRNAFARMEESNFNLDATRSALFPSLSANGFSSRSDTANTNPMSIFDAGLDANWEVDVWGKIRSSVQASQANQLALTADFENARQSLAAQTMQAWFELIAAEKRLELDQRRVASFTTTKSLVNRRFELGQASLAEVDFANTDFENARADVEASHDRRDRAARQLRVLTGSYPDSKWHATTWPELNSTIPANLPSDLLRNRPDIIAAYQRVRSADARTQVAHTDLFPSFGLNGSTARQGEKLSDLARSSFSSWTIIANISAPILDGGRRKAERNAASKRAEQTYYNYQSVVINAFREVENALGSEAYLAREEIARISALNAAQQAFERIQRDYEAGVADLLSLLEIQRRVFSTERQTINLKASRLSNRVSLALALGTGI